MAGHHGNEPGRVNVTRASPEHHQSITGHCAPHERATIKTASTMADRSPRLQGAAGLVSHGQNEYVTSIIRRRAGLAGSLGDLAKMALPDGLPFPGQEAAPGMGCVGPRPRRAGPVGHKPRTPAPAGWGAWAPRPVERGLWATSPVRPAGRPRLPAGCQTMNAASTTRRRAGLAGRLGDLDNTPLSITVPQS